MTYNIYKTDGTKLVDLIDGLVDKTTTDLTLIGKSYTGFGQVFNENLVKLLENFSSTTAPLYPVQGQLWYNKAQNRLQVYSSTGWKPAGGNIYSPLRPVDSLEGDIWIDSSNKQLNFYDGTAWTLVGPTWTEGQGITGFVADSLFDAQGNANAVLKLYVSDVLFGIYSKAAFNPIPAIPGFDTGLVVGYNSNSLQPVLFNQNSYSADSLYAGTETDPLTNITSNVYLNHEHFMRVDQETHNLNKITISSNDGLTIGSKSNVNFRVSETTYFMENVIAGGNISIRTKDTSAVNDSIFINAYRNRVGIFTSNPQETLDVNGTVKIRGDLIVEGNNLVVNVGTVTIEDKTIQLATVSDITPINGTITSTSTNTTITNITSTTGLTTGMQLIKISGTGNFGGFTTITSVDSDTQITIQSTTANTAGAITFTAKGETDISANGAGIIIKGITDKTILYNNTTNYKTFDISENLNLASGKEFRIGNVPVLQLPGVNNGVLTSAISSAPGLTSIGNQVELTAGRLKLLDNKIMALSTDDDIVLEPNGAGNIVLLGSPKITGLADPRTTVEGLQDAATRAYAEHYAKSLPLSISFIDNSLSDTVNNEIINYLNDVAAPAYYVDGKIGFVHVVHIDFIAQVVTRTLKKFTISGGSWIFVSDLPNHVI